MMVWYTFITSRNPFAEYFADTAGQCVLSGNTREKSVGGGVNKVVDERKAASRCEILSLVADVCVPGEKGGLNSEGRMMIIVGNVPRTVLVLTWHCQVGWGITSTTYSLGEKKL
jgi:hypothetical protein